MRQQLFIVFSIISFVSCISQNDKKRNIRVLNYTSIDSALLHPQDVYSLTISDSALINLPQKLTLLNNMRVLNINGTSIHHWPDYLFHLKLDTLRLIHIKILPETIDTIKSKMPGTIVIYSPGFIKCYSIKECDFSNNDKWVSLDLTATAELADLAKLDNRDKLNIYELGISGDLISKIPEQIGDISELRSIEILNSPIKTLPGTIGKLKKARAIYIDKCLINQLPVEIGNMENLVELRLFENDIKKLPVEISNLSRLEMLDLTRNDISVFPAGIIGLKSLKSLTLPGNDIKTIPEDISSLQNLEDLNLNQNQLKTLPESMKELTHLTHLNIGDNEFEAFPMVVCSLSSLQTLYLGYFHELPASFSDLKHLNKLYVGGLKKFPPVLTELPELVELHISNPQFNSFPESIAHMKKLKKISISSNNFSDGEKKHLQEMLPDTKVIFE